MDEDHRLATYGSLAPGRPNHSHVAGLRGRWFPGQVRGRLLEAGWGAALGYPGMLLDPDGPAIDVQVLESADLPGQWSRLDDFEGPAYERVLTSVETATGAVDAYLYVLVVPEES
jgi:gamma-glutamylcyclotransferase (GGCT)/AIG2-like uncharacterized protein YtfP